MFLPFLTHFHFQKSSNRYLMYNYGDEEEPVVPGDGRWCLWNHNAARSLDFFSPKCQLYLSLTTYLSPCPETNGWMGNAVRCETECQFIAMDEDSWCVKNSEAGLTIEIPVIHIKYPGFLSSKTLSWLIWVLFLLPFINFCHKVLK